MNPETTHAPQAGAHQAEGAETQGRALAPPSFALAATPPPAAPPASPSQPNDVQAGAQQLDGVESEHGESQGDSEVVNQNRGGLHRHRHGTVVVDYHAPISFSGLTVSAGESMIFRSVAHNGTAGSADTFETQYSIRGAAEFDMAGSGVMRKVLPGLDSGNVPVVVGAGFNRGSFQVRSVIRNLTQNRNEVTMTWILRPRTSPRPTSMAKVAGPSGTAWANAPASYTYQLGPDLNGANTAGNYAGQTFLERFGTISALGFTMNDLTTDWKAANPTLNTPDLVARNLFNSGGNSTFVIEANDQSTDTHDGFGQISPFRPDVLAGATGVGYRLPQDYVVAGAVIGSCNIDRRIISNGVQIRKSDPVP